jgi:hypothetical protein
MSDFLSLSLRAAELATRPIRMVVAKLVDFVTEDEPPRATPAPPTPDPRFEREPHPEPPQTHPGPEPEAPSPKAARRAARHEPTRGQAATIRAEQREEEWGDEPGPGANIVIDERLTGPGKP